MHETQVWPLGWEDPLEKRMATHSSILALRIPWIEEEPGGLQSMGLQRVGHGWVTNTQSDFHSWVSIGEVTERTWPGGWPVSWVQAIRGSSLPALCLVGLHSWLPEVAPTDTALRQWCGVETIWMEHMTEHSDELLRFGRQGCGCPGQAS